VDLYGRRKKKVSWREKWVHRVETRKRVGMKELIGR